MSKRIDLLNELERRAVGGQFRVPETVKRTVWKAVSEALTAMVSATPLAVARELSGPDREMLEATIQEVLSVRDVKALSAMWEPERGTIDPSVEQGLRRDTVELLMGEREPYRGLPRSLADVQSMSDKQRKALRVTLERIAPTNHLREALKAWAPGTRLPAGSGRAAIAKHLLDLVEEPFAERDAAPAEEPAPSRGRRRAAAREEAPAAGDHHAWQPVKGKPGRRKRRLPNGKWHYEDVPMQKAGERRAEYLLRLMRFHLGEM